MFVKVLGIFVLLVVLCVFMAVMTAEPWYDVTDSKFLSPNNIENLLRRTALYGILGIGVAFVIISSGIDLSVGSVVCLSGCLLAIFLHVDYRAFDEAEVYRVKAREKIILVDGRVENFTAGDQVRYFGGRRAGTGVFKLENVETRDVVIANGEPDLEANSGAKRTLTLLHVDREFTNDDRMGRVAKALSINEFDDAAATITLPGRLVELASRDQLMLVHPTSGRKNLAVAEVNVADDATVVTMSGALGSSFSTEWLAIPAERRQRMSIPMALLSVLGIALLIGILHGLLVTQMKLQPFVVTLCGLLIYRSISRWLVSDQPVGFLDEYDATLRPMGAGKLSLTEPLQAVGFEGEFGLPYPFLLMLVIAILAAIFLNLTIWGRYLLALGRNEEAARYSGINTNRVTMIAYILSTCLAAIGGMLFALDSNSISPSSFGNFFELYAIAAAVLGGCSLRGGEGSILGVIIGTAMMQVLYNLILLLKISGTLELGVIGVVILVGVLADEAVKRIAAQRKRVLQARAAEADNEAAESDS